MCPIVWGRGYHVADEIVNAFGVAACYLCAAQVWFATGSEIVDAYQRAMLS